MTSYEAAGRAAGWADRSHRIRVRFEGKDRARSLHNLTTQDINHLQPGQNREAFVTSLQGKTLAFAAISADEDSLLLRTERESWDVLRPHLSKYLMLDQTEFADISGSTFELHVIGPQSSALLSQFGAALSDEEGARAAASIDGRSVILIRESPTGRPGWTVIGASDDRDAIARGLEVSGAVAIDAPTFEALRIEAGTPASGIDVLPENLPQEFNRDAKAIHFRKGCYLGQETVARLDALGHVNKILRGLAIETADAGLPAPGTALQSEGKGAGTVLSVAISPESGRPIALGMIRVKHAEPGTRLTLANDGGTAEVRALPMRSFIPSES